MQHTNLNPLGRAGHTMWLAARGAAVLFVAGLGLFMWLCSAGHFFVQTEVAGKGIRVEEAGIYRLAKLEWDLSPREMQQVRFLENGRALLRVEGRQFLTPENDGTFWLRDRILRFVPSQGVDPLAVGTRLVLATPRRLPGWLLLTWTVAFAALGLTWVFPFVRGLVWPCVPTSANVRISPRPALAGGSFLGVVGAVIFIRFGHKLADPFMVAEDGFVFFREDLAYGAEALMRPYAGYLHLMPRLIAWLGGCLGVEAAPMVYTVAAAVVLLGCLWLVWVFLGRGLTAWSAGLALALYPANLYLFLNPTNLQWFLGFALSCLAVGSWKPQRSWQGVAAAVFSAVAGLTGPFTILALPAFFLRWWRLRDAWSGLFLTMQALTSALQAVCLLQHRQPHDTLNPGALLGWAAGISGDIFLSPALWPERSAWLQGLAVFLALVFAAVAVSQAVAGHRRRGSTGTWSLLVLMGGFLAAGYLRYGEAGSPWGDGERYFVVPALLGVVLLTEAAGSHSGGLRWPALVLLGLVCLTWFTVQAPTVLARNWQLQLAALPPCGGFVQGWPPYRHAAFYIARDPETGRYLSGKAYLEAEAAAAQ